METFSVFRDVNLFSNILRPKQKGRLESGLIYADLAMIGATLKEAKTFSQSSLQIRLIQNKSVSFSNQESFQYCCIVFTTNI